MTYDQIRTLISTNETQHGSSDKISASEVRAVDNALLDKIEEIGGVINAPFLIYKGLLNQEIITSSSGLLVVGNTYRIVTLEIGDDFSNVGYVSEGVDFVATGITPAVWSNTTVVINVTDSAPVFTAINNTLGDITWTWDDKGKFTGTKSGSFAAGTFSSPQFSAGIGRYNISRQSIDDSLTLVYSILGARIDDNTIKLTTLDELDSPADGLLVDFEIEIQILL